MDASPTSQFTHTVSKCHSTFVSQCTFQLTSLIHYSAIILLKKLVRELIIGIYTAIYLTKAIISLHLLYTLYRMLHYFTWEISACLHALNVVVATCDQQPCFRVSIPSHTHLQLVHTAVMLLNTLSYCMDVKVRQLVTMWVWTWYIVASLQFNA